MTVVDGGWMVDGWLIFVKFKDRLEPINSLNIEHDSGPFTATGGGFLAVFSVETLYAASFHFIILYMY